MGSFSSWLFENGTWRPARLPEPSLTPWLHIDIYDSDVGTVRYWPEYDGSGTAFVGFTPRIYFEDEDASTPTDRNREASALSHWIAAQVGGCLTDLPSVVRAYLAEDVEPDWELPDDGDLDEAEIFVEVKIAAFLDAVNMPIPEGLLD